MTILNIYMYIYIHLKWIANKFHIAHETQCYVTAWMEGELGGEWTEYMYG